MQWRRSATRNGARCRLARDLPACVGGVGGLCIASAAIKFGNRILPEKVKCHDPSEEWRFWWGVAPSRVPSAAFGCQRGRLPSHARVSCRYCMLGN